MKNVLITGVCGGMGIATARLLLKKGFAVYGLDCRDCCNEAEVFYHKADLTRELSLLPIVKELQGIKFYAIIHFAGIYNMNSLIEMPEEEFTRIFDINLGGVYRVNKCFYPLLEEGGRIIITSSELAPLSPLPFTGIYGVTKSALEGYAYSLRMELNLLGNKVVVIRPGAVETGLLNASTTALDRLCDNTKLYTYNAQKFKKIVNGVESKSVSPDKIAKLTLKALTKKKPKLVYNINRNALLRLLNALPKKFQLFIIKRILLHK